MPNPYLSTLKTLFLENGPVDAHKQLLTLAEINCSSSSSSTDSPEKAIFLEKIKTCTHIDEAITAINNYLNASAHSISVIAMLNTFFSLNPEYLTKLNQSAKDHIDTKVFTLYTTEDLDNLLELDHFKFFSYLILFGFAAHYFTKPEQFASLVQHAFIAIKFKYIKNQNRHSFYIQDPNPYRFQGLKALQAIDELITDSNLSKKIFNFLSEIFIASPPSSYPDLLADCVVLYFNKLNDLDFKNAFIEKYLQTSAEYDDFYAWHAASFLKNLIKNMELSPTVLKVREFISEKNKIFKPREIQVPTVSDKSIDEVLLSFNNEANPENFESICNLIASHLNTLSKTEHFKKLIEELLSKIAHNNYKIFRPAFSLLRQCIEFPLNQKSLVQEIINSLLHIQKQFRGGGESLDSSTGILLKLIAQLESDSFKDEINAVAEFSLTNSNLINKDLSGLLVMCAEKISDEKLQHLITPLTKNILPLEECLRIQKINRDEMLMGQAETDRNRQLALYDNHKVAFAMLAKLLKLKTIAFKQRIKILTQLLNGADAWSFADYDNKVKLAIDNFMTHNTHPNDLQFIVFGLLQNHMDTNQSGIMSDTGILFTEMALELCVKMKSKFPGREALNDKLVVDSSSCPPTGLKVS